MTTPSTLANEIYRQKGVYSKHPSVTWFNQRTGSAYYANALFCASGLSQAFDKIGLGSATGGPFIWTVAWYNWCLNNLSRVSPSSAQDGDIVFFKFPASGDRTSAPVNHVTTYRGQSGSSILVRGFNEGSGGTGGVVGDAAYSSTYLVAIFRTPWGKGSSTPAQSKPEQNENTEEEEATMKGCTYKNGNTQVYMLFNENSGFVSEFSAGAGNGPMKGDYVNPLARNWGTNSWPTITASHANAIKRDLAKVREGVK